MKSIDEEIWDYIDGNLNEIQKAELEVKITTDPAYKALFQELQSIHLMMNADELDEPSMSFSRKVMDQVQQEIAPVALKTKVNRTIIYGIAALFILSILSIFLYAAATYKLKTPGLPASFNFSVDLQPIMNPAFIKAFLLVDLIIALVWLDGLLRSRRSA